MTSTMAITIIIPVKPGGPVAALAELQKLCEPNVRLEILVSEGTRPSRQRNEAAAAAQGEILYVLDDDSLVAADALAVIAGHFADPGVAAVGGPSLTPAEDSPLQQAFGMAFASALGGGGVRNRYRQVGTTRRCGDEELILCNLAFRRDVFLAMGGLDERLYPNEENELLDRLRQQGYQLVHDPALAVRRSQRSTPRAFVRQLYGYGRGRGEQTRLSGRVKPASLVPVAFVAYLCLLPFCPGYCLFPLAIYLLAVLATAGLAWRERRVAGIALRLLWILPTLHVAYGLGMVRGLLSPRYLQGVPAGKVTLRVVREMDADPTGVAPFSAGRPMA